MPERLLVISRQQCPGQALVRFLSTLPDVQGVDQCAQPDDAVQLVERLHPDTVILDAAGIGNPTQLTVAIAHPTARIPLSRKRVSLGAMAVRPRLQA